ncbi:MAG: TIGR04150 pseudo-rSAM protein [Mediterranea massiliensis]|nr:TIGR04150 pseudo-rSAM protein [Mediterranea massiliensis]
MEYLFYLEPYTFILQNEKKTVLYNTINSAYIPCPESAEIQTIIQTWDKAENGYCTILNEDTFNIQVVKCFITTVRESFSGDCIPWKKGKQKPYIFKPTLFLNTELRIKEENSRKILGERILLNLHEVTFYLPSKCEIGCIACDSYYRQMNHCRCKDEVIALTLENYRTLLLQLQIAGVRKVNLIGGISGKENYLYSLVKEFKNSTYKKCVYLDWKQRNKFDINAILKYNTEVFITVQPEDLIQISKNIKTLHYKEKVTWHLIVAEEKNIEQIEALITTNNFKIKIIPFYNGTNIEFFQKNVYMNLEDIIEQPINRKTIYRHKILNDNFFGKLIVMPSGYVHASINTPPIGNILECSFKELVYKELTENDTWLKVRANLSPCSQCINKDLCPPISNYEQVIGKNNLCYLQ